MNPQSDLRDLGRTITVAVSCAAGLLLSDLIPHAIFGGKPLAWGREAVSSMVGGAIIACVYSLGRSLWNDLSARNSSDDHDNPQ